MPCIHSFHIQFYKKTKRQQKAYFGHNFQKCKINLFTT